MNKQEIINTAIETIEKEYHSIYNLKNYINETFVKIINVLFNCKGRIIITGIGKSAIIAQKIVATLNSTGTPSIFMHAADAIHGDLGIIQADDVVICISKSGNTPEITELLPLIKMNKNIIIGMTGNENSYLAQNADYLLNTYVSEEACPNNLAPTSSTTTQLVMGDVIAVSLLKLKGFSSKDFAKFHPGGALGKKLYMPVSDLIINNEIPKVKINDDIKTVIIEISTKRLGVTAVVNENKICGIITDGDLRRMMQKNKDFLNLTAEDIMTKSFQYVSINELAVNALEKMRNKNITSLLVLDEENYVGVVHIHDILKEGII